MTLSWGLHAGAGSQVLACTQYHDGTDPMKVQDVNAEPYPLPLQARYFLLLKHCLTFLADTM